MPPCGRSACTLAPPEYQSKISKTLQQDPSQLEWQDIEKYKPTYNAGPTTYLPIVYMVNRPIVKKEEEEENTTRIVSRKNRKRGRRRVEEVKKELEDFENLDPSVFEMDDEIEKQIKLVPVKQEPKDDDEIYMKQETSQNGEESKNQILKPVKQEPKQEDLIKQEPIQEPKQEPKQEPTQDTKQIFKIHTMRWGLVPSFLKTKETKMTLHNARGETAMQKPIFKRLFSKNRCVAFIDGFFEWKRDQVMKQPYFVKRKDNQLMCIAGLYDEWKEEELFSFTLLTVSPGKDFSWLHDRIPVILNSKEDIEKWLNTEKYSAEEAYKLVKHAPEGILDVYKVSTIVNNTRNNSPKCIQRLENSKSTLFGYFTKKNPEKRKANEISHCTENPLKKVKTEK